MLPQGLGLIAWKTASIAHLPATFSSLLSKVSSAVVSLENPGFICLLVSFLIDPAPLRFDLHGIDRSLSPALSLYLTEAGSGRRLTSFAFPTNAFTLNASSSNRYSLVVTRACQRAFPNTWRCGSLSSSTFLPISAEGYLSVWAEALEFLN